MSGGGGGSSGVTRVEPSELARPYLQHGYQQAQALYNQGPTVVPFSPQTEQALQMTQQRALSGSPVTQAAQSFVQQGLTTPVTSMFGSATNPYLDATFNRAALATQNQLASEFARSGRNVGAAEPLRAQQLNDLATNIYGGAYESERNRMLSDLTSQRANQLGLLPYVTPLAEADYRDIGALAGVGSQIEGLAQSYADAPGNALDQYLARITGIPGGQTQTTTQNMQRNRLGGALGGAAAGSVFGPWGTLGGAVLGGIFG